MVGRHNGTDSAHTDDLDASRHVCIALIAQGRTMHHVVNPVPHPPRPCGAGVNTAHLHPTFATRLTCTTCGNDITDPVKEC